MFTASWTISIFAILMFVEEVVMVIDRVGGNLYVDGHFLV